MKHPSSHHIFHQVNQTVTGNEKGKAALYFQLQCEACATASLYHVASRLYVPQLLKLIIVFLITYLISLHTLKDLPSNLQGSKPHHRQFETFPGKISPHLLTKMLTWLLIRLIFSLFFPLFVVTSNNLGNIPKGPHNANKKLAVVKALMIISLSSG
jgi:hypothetical protein